MTALGSPLLSNCLVSGVGRSQLPQEDSEFPWESQEGKKALEVLLATACPLLAWLGRQHVLPAPCCFHSTFVKSTNNSG